MPKSIKLSELISQYYPVSNLISTFLIFFPKEVCNFFQPFQSKVAKEWEHINSKGKFPLLTNAMNKKNTLASLRSINLFFQRHCVSLKPWCINFEKTTINTVSLRGIEVHVVLVKLNLNRHLFRFLLQIHWGTKIQALLFEYNLLTYIYIV